MKLVLKSLKQRVDDALQDEFTANEKLQNAMRYSLISGGKRVRPVLTLLVADALGNDLPVMQSALAVEFSHTASLIADDLPSMDNEYERRGKKSLHAKFGEATAILASYALITAAFGKITDNGKEILRLGLEDAQARTMLSVEIASKASGHKGATLGQQLDLFEKPDSIESLEKLIYLKSVTLFEVAMCFGWIFGGGDLQKLEEVKKASFKLGMAFQVRDDIQDYHEDKKRNCASNFAVLVGRKKAIETFEDSLHSFCAFTAQLGIWGSSFQSLITLLQEF